MNWKSFENMFTNAKNLLYLPNNKLVQTYANYCVDLDVVTTGYYVYNTNNMFKNCINLTYIPPKLKLHKHILKLDNMFEKCFSQYKYAIVIDNKEIKTYSDIIPEGSFIPVDTLNTKPIKVNLDNLFKNCTHMTGTVDGTNLWNSSYSTNFTTLSAYFNCVSLTNYNQIPSSWTGDQETGVNDTNSWK